MKTSRFAEVMLAAVLAGFVGSYLTYKIMLNSAAVARRSVAINAEEIQGVVADYIARHPSLIVAALDSERAKQTMQQQSRASASIHAHHAEIFADSSSPTMGAANGDVDIAEFFDFRCLYCKNTAPLLGQLLNHDPHVKIVFKSLPVLGPDSVYAARLGFAAARVGRFGDFYTAVFANAPAHADRLSIDKAVRSTGLDPAVLDAHSQDRDTDNVLRRNSRLAADLGITGTPALVIGDRLLLGAPTEEELIAAVSAARRKQ